MECNEDVDAIIYTVPPEQWQLAASERPFSSSHDALPSFPLDKHSQRPPSSAVSLPKVQTIVNGPQIFDVATPPPRSRAAREHAVNSPPEDTFRPLQQLDELRPLSQREKKSAKNYDLLSDHDSDSDVSQKSPFEFLTWNQIPSEGRQVCERSSSFGINRTSTALRRATPSHFMVGDPLIFMNEPDPTTRQVHEFAKWIRSSLWREQRKDLDKWVGSRKSALFEAKGTPLEITNWDSMLSIFFDDNAIINPIIQARLATQTFRGLAAN